MKNFAETNANKQQMKKTTEKEIPESPSNYNKNCNFPGITYNPDLPGGAETFNSMKLEWLII